MSKPYDSNVEKWSEEHKSTLIKVLHDDERKYLFNGSRINGPHWRVIIDLKLENIKTIMMKTSLRQNVED